MGWDMTIATDTAFAVALIVILGERVLIERRGFLTAHSLVVPIMPSSSAGTVVKRYRCLVIGHIVECDWCRHGYPSI